MDKRRQLNISIPKFDLRNMQRRSIDDLPPPSLKVKIISFIVFLIASIGLASLTIYAYLNTQPVKDISDLPIVLRDPSPIRTQSTQPGGLVVSHQNKAIYYQLKKNGAIIQHQVADTDQKKIEQVIKRYFSNNEVEKINDEVKVDVEALPVEGSTKVAEDSTKVESASGTIFDLIPQGSDKIKIRIAVLKSHTEADYEWGRLSKKFKFLQSYKHRITEKVAKNGNHMFYLWVVDLKEDAARKVCDQLKQHNNGCFVVHG